MSSSPLLDSARGTDCLVYVDQTYGHVLSAASLGAAAMSEKPEMRFV